MRGLVLVLCASWIVGCGGDGGSLAIEMEMWPLTSPAAADPGTPMADEATGLADLSRFPVLVTLRVEADDLDGPINATWPAEVPEQMPTTVEVAADVPAGTERRVIVTLIVAEEAAPVETYVSPGPGQSPATAEVTSGQVADVEVELVRLRQATVQAQWQGQGELASVAWVDDRAGAMLPPAFATGTSAAAVITVGRSYWPRVVLSDGTVRDLDSQLVRAQSEGELVQVTLR